MLGLDAERETLREKRRRTMERATQVTILIFGVLNLVFAAVGLYMSGETFAHPGHLSDNQPPLSWSKPSMA